MRWRSLLVLAGIAALASASDPASAQVYRDSGATFDAATVTASADAGATTTSASGSTASTRVADPRFAALPELTWRAVNTREVVRARLYRADGTVDPAVMSRLSHLLRDIPTGEDSPVVARTLQLIVKIAARFDAREVEIVSAYRTGRSASGRRVRREGYHGVGSAIDFRLVGVEPVMIAAYARTFSHVGVGLYPRLNFVHIDSRETSFFWENRAGRSHHGYDRPLARDGLVDRERSWSTDADLPWDPPGVTIALDTHPRTAAGAHRTRRHARRGGRHHRRHHHRRHRPELHVFAGSSTR